MMGIDEAKIGVLMKFYWFIFRDGKGYKFIQRTLIIRLQYILIIRVYRINYSYCYCFTQDSYNCILRP